MKILIVCPSYKRADKLETPEYIKDILVVICKSQEEEYREKNPKVHFAICPDKVQGNIARVRNWILDTYLPLYHVVVTVDDDLQGLFIWEDRKANKIEGKAIRLFIEKYTILAQELEAYLWGLNLNMDPQCYREMVPFNLTAYIGAPFQAVLNGNDLRYDEKIPLKEDYDFSLQNVNCYRKVLRVNKAYYNVRQVEQAGGCSEMRSIKEEEVQLLLLRRKWGSEIVKQSDRSTIARNRKKAKRIQINPILHIPIKGV